MGKRKEFAFKSAPGATVENKSVAPDVRDDGNGAVVERALAKVRDLFEAKSVQKMTFLKRSSPRSG